jgi:hypothetical protein
MAENEAGLAVALRADPTEPMIDGIPEAYFRVFIGKFADNYIGNFRKFASIMNNKNISSFTKFLKYISFDVMALFLSLFVGSGAFYLLKKNYIYAVFFMLSESLFRFLIVFIDFNFRTPSTLIPGLFDLLWHSAPYLFHSPWNSIHNAYNSTAIVVMVLIFLIVPTILAKYLYYMQCRREIVRYSQKAITRFEFISLLHNAGKLDILILMGYLVFYLIINKFNLYVYAKIVMR